MHWVPEASWSTYFAKFSFPRSFCPPTPKGVGVQKERYPVEKKQVGFLQLTEFECIFHQVLGTWALLLKWLKENYPEERITVFSKLLKCVQINFVPVINESFDQSKSNTKVGERNKKNIYIFWDPSIVCSLVSICKFHSKNKLINNRSS